MHLIRLFFFLKSFHHYNKWFKEWGCPACQVHSSSFIQLGCDAKKAVWHQSRNKHLSLPPSNQLFIWSHTHLKFPEWTGAPNWVLCQKDMFCLPFLTYAALQGNVEGEKQSLPQHVAMCTGRNKVRRKANGETVSFWGLVSVLLWTM